jgi:ABC-type sugar transport system permease subunit
VAVSSIWANLGFTFIIVTSGLQGIPRDLHEAAAVDGAGGVRRFWNITLPMLGPTMIFLVVVLTTRAFQVYGEIDLLTEGGPDPERSTTNLPYLIFGTRSVVQSDAGLKATISVLLFLVLLVLSAVQLRGMSKRVTYGG